MKENEKLLKENMELRARLAEAEKHIERLSQEHNALKMIVENTPIGLAVTDEKGRISLVNSSFEQIWGNPQPNAQKIKDYKKYRAWWIDTGKPVLATEWASEKVIHTGKQVVDQMIEIKRFDGKRAFIINSAVPLLNDQGRLTGSIVSITDITECKRAEETLQKSEERLRLAQEAANVGVWDWDAGTSEIVFTPGFNKLYGLPPGTLKRYQDWRERVHPDDITSFEIKRNAAIRNHKPFDLEFRGRHSSGEYRWISTKGGAFYDEAGQITRILGVNLDITEHKAVEKKLRESEALYRSIGESIDYGVWVCTPDGRNVYASESFLKMVGITQEQCSNFGWANMLHPEDAERNIAAWQECVRTRGKWNIEHRFLGVDGQWHHVLARGVPVRDEHGDITCWAGINLDISELKQLEAQLFSSRNFLRSIIDNTSAFIFVLDLNECFLVANKALAKILNTEPKEMIGKKRIEFIPREIADRHRDNDLEVIRTGKALEFEEYIDYKGLSRTFLTTKFPLYNAQGQIYAVAGISSDISERKKMEEILKQDKETFQKLVQEKTKELIESQIELERAKRLSDIGTLASTVAHELRNPLAAIGMASYNLKRKIKNPDMDKHLRTIEKKITESDQIINNLLFYSRLKPPNIEQINIADIIQECAEITRAHCKKGDSIVKYLDPVINLKINADPTQIKEVIHNILNNACDALPPTDGKIEITCTYEENFVKIVIKDNGHGIDQKTLPKIFDPFFSTKARGTGLGLAVCRQILAYHNGTIGIDSEPGKGTSVTVCLPDNGKANNR